MSHMHADCKEAAYTVLISVSADHLSLTSNLPLNVVFCMQSTLDCICCMCYGFLILHHLLWCRIRTCSSSESEHEFHDFFRTYLFFSWAI